MPALTLTRPINHGAGAVARARLMSRVFGTAFAKHLAIVFRMNAKELRFLATNRCIVRDDRQITMRECEMRNSLRATPWATQFPQKGTFVRKQISRCVACCVSLWFRTALFPRVPGLLGFLLRRHYHENASLWHARSVRPDARVGHGRSRLGRRNPGQIQKCPGRQEVLRRD